MSTQLSNMPAISASAGFSMRFRFGSQPLAAFVRTLLSVLNIYYSLTKFEANLRYIINHDLPIAMLRMASLIKEVYLPLQILTHSCFAAYLPFHNIKNRRKPIPALYI